MTRWAVAGGQRDAAIMKRLILPVCLCLSLAGCGLDLAQAQSILQKVTQSPLFEPTRNCVGVGLEAEGSAGDKARAVGRCLAFGLGGGAEAAPVISDEDLELIGEKALALDRQVEATSAAISAEDDGASDLARGCRVLEGELANELDRCLGVGRAGR